eukprot:scaffold1130_cov127-Isochrysis_galbana.AAC.12
MLNINIAYCTRFLQLLQELELRAVLGVGVARVRASGSRMMAWITYGGPDGAGALGREGGALLWEYELYGGAQLAPHRLYVFARLLTPPKGVWEGPRAMVHLSRDTRCRFLSPPPCAFLASSPPPRAWLVLGKCACFCAEGIGSPSPAKEGGLSCGGANNNNHK